MKTALQIIGALGLVVMLGGCATTQPLHYTFEELGAESATHQGSDGLEYRSAITIHGMGNPQSVGGFLNVPRESLPELYATPTSTACSRIVEQGFEAKSLSDDEFGSLVTAVDGLIQNQAALAAIQIKLQLIETASNTPSGSPLVSTLKATLAVKSLESPELETAKIGLLAEQAKITEDIAKQQVGVVQTTAKPNVMILRWTLDKKASLVAKLGELFSGNVSEHQTRSGYLIVAGLRIATLQPGDDLALWLSRERDFGRTGADAVFNKNFITTQQISANHQAFREDASLEHAIAAHLKLNLSQVTPDFAKIIQQQTLDAAFALQETLLSSNRGRVERTSLHLYHYRFWGDSAQDAAAKQELLRGAEFTPIYSIRAGLDRLKSKKPEDKGSLTCAHMVPESGPVETSDPEQRGTRYCLPDGWDDASSLVRRKNNPNAATWKPDINHCIDFKDEI